MNHVEKIVELLGKSYSAFHAVKNIKEELLEAFENDVTNNKLSRIGIPNEVA